jgi:hypothetical protein
MTIKVPTGLRSFFFPEVTPLTFDRFDVELMMPMLFFRVITRDGIRHHQPRQALKIDEVIDQLQNHKDVVGFDGERGRNLLGRLVRTAMVQVGRKGKRKDKSPEQILGVTVPSLLAFKPGFPAQTSLLANVDRFLYSILLQRFADWNGLQEFFKETFGAGVDVWDRGNPSGIFNESGLPVDTLTRLGLAFLDELEPAGLARKSGSDVQAHAWDSVPAVTEKLGDDLVSFLYAYRSLMPPEALMGQTRGLVNFQLFIYTLKLVYAINALTDDPSQMPRAMVPNATLDATPEIYLDFAGASEPLSREMTNWCVRRDLDAFQRFISSKIELRQISSYAKQLAKDTHADPKALAAGEERDAPRRLQLLLELRDDLGMGREIQAEARATLREIRQANVADEDAESEDLNRVLRSEPTALSSVVALLVQAQKPIHANVMKWYSGVGGTTKPYGIIQGGKSRNTWRYAPGNELLSILVQLAQVSVGDSSGTAPRAIKLREFVDYLYTRFGILVDRPPSGLVGPEYVAAAQANLNAMLDRLREMGVFRDLSDDFTVQRLTPTYSTIVTEEIQ